MSRFILSFLLCICSSAFAGTWSIQNPYSGRTNHYRVLIHQHTTESDGNTDPADIGAFYAAASFDAYTITDHSLVTADPGTPGIIFIPGEEITTSIAPNPHINSIFCSSLIAADTPQIVLNAISTAGGFAILNHPDYTRPWTTNDLVTLTNYPAMEIWNELLAENSEVKWDYALFNGKRPWAIAGADNHTTGTTNTFAYVSANELTYDALHNAVTNGAFTCGYKMHLNITVTNNVVYGDTDGVASTFEWIVNGPGTNRITAAVSSDSYTMQAGDGYVRLRVTSGTKRAWSQPIFGTYFPKSINTPTLRIGTLIQP